MNTEGPFRIEFEISSLCNALCSGCQRTMMWIVRNDYYKVIYQLLKCMSGLMMLI